MSNIVHCTPVFLFTDMCQLISGIAGDEDTIHCAEMRGDLALKRCEEFWHNPLKHPAAFVEVIQHGYSYAPEIIGDHFMLIGEDESCAQA